MKRLIIYIWATLLCCAAYAQTPNVTGRVVSSGGLPVEGVVVSDGSTARRPTPRGAMR